MNFLKKLSLAFAAIAFCLSLYVATSYAQPGRAGWKNNNGKSRGWYRGQRNGWDNGRKRGWRNRSVLVQQDNRWRNGRLSQWEMRRLQRQRARINRTQNRYYNNDGYISNRERRRLQQRYNNYQRRVRRDRRDW